LSDDPRNATDILHTEQLLLKSLCTDPGTAKSEQLKSSLSNYKWCSTDHSIVFQALNRLSSASTAAQLREQLPSQLTRMGFPDVNCEIFFEGEITEK
jgi:replicative DNA helicase